MVTYLIFHNNFANTPINLINLNFTQIIIQKNVSKCKLHNSTNFYKEHIDQLRIDMAAKFLMNSRQICQYLEKSQRRIILDSLICLVAKIPNEETEATTDLLSCDLVHRGVLPQCMLEYHTPQEGGTPPEACTPQEACTPLPRKEAPLKHAPLLGSMHPPSRGRRPP